MAVLWAHWGSGMGSLGMLRDLESLSENHEGWKKVSEITCGVWTHTMLLCGPHAPHIHGAFLLPSSLLSFQQLIILFLGMMN